MFLCLFACLFICLFLLDAVSLTMCIYVLYYNKFNTHCLQIYSSILIIIIININIIIYIFTFWGGISVLSVSVFLCFAVKKAQ